MLALRFAPLNTSLFQKKVTPTTDLSPDRGVKGNASVWMFCECPKRIFVREQVHEKRLFAATGADHGDMPMISILANNVAGVFI